MIEKPEEHDINRAGKRLLRDVLESLGWVVNDVQEDYGIDSNVQVFEGKSPTGTWFHVQLKSSTSSAYNVDRTFISQELSVAHARHYALEMREPILVIHADVTSNRVYWYSPQLDQRLLQTLNTTAGETVTVRIPTASALPETTATLLTCLDKIYLIRGAREIGLASTSSFMDSVKHLPNQEELYRAFQQKNDSLKLLKIVELHEQKQFKEARPRAQSILADPDSTVEVKFWAQLQLFSIDFSETLTAGKPQIELARVHLASAEVLRTLTSSGPRCLKFYSIIDKKAAELDLLTHEQFGLFMALRQNLERNGDPMMAIGMYARRSANTKRLIFKYNQCLRLARYAANYSDRWVLGRALTGIVSAIAPYLGTLHTEQRFEAHGELAESALEVCKLAAWIGHETKDSGSVVLAIMSSLMTVRTEDSDAYRWAVETAQSLINPEVRDDALARIERAVKRWKGEHVEGDYRGDTIWQIIQNVATAIGVDLSNESDPFVQSLRIAAKDNSPERALATCEHLLVGLGSVGPRAQRIKQLFAIDTAGSKVVHCTLHDYHYEGKELDVAYEDLRRGHCDACPDRKPRQKGWRFTADVRRELEDRHRVFIDRLAGTKYGFRFTDED